MAAFKTLAVNLVARTGVFEKKMNRARKTTKSFRSGIAGSLGTLRRFATGLLAVAGIGGMTILIKNTLASIDVVAKLSRRLGIATEDLIALQHAASITGVSAEALNKSLDMFVRRLGELTTGAGEAERGFDILGMSFTDVIDKNPMEAFKLIADRIKEIPSNAKKAAAAYFLFGRAGAQLVNLFNEGSEGIAEFQREAERLGITFSEFDAAKVEEANDAFTRMKAVLRGVVQRATIELSPVLEAIANQFIDTGIQANTAGAISINAFEDMANAARIAMIPFKFLHNTLKGIASILLDIGGFLASAGGIFSDKGKKWAGAFGDIALELRNEAKEGFGGLMQTDPLGGFFDKIRGDSEKLRAELEANADARARLEQGGGGGFDIEAAESLAKNAERLKESLKGPAEQLRDMSESLHEMQAAGHLTGEQLAAGLHVAIQRSLRSLTNLKEGLEAPIETLKTIRDISAGLLERGFITQEKHLQNLRSAAEAIVKAQRAGMDSAINSSMSGGEFRQIRTALVDVQGLSRTGGNSVLNKLNDSNVIAEETNRILAAIERKTEPVN